MKIKLIEGEPAAYVSRGTHRMDLTGYDAVLIVSERAPLDMVAEALIEHWEGLEDTGVTYEGAE